MDNPVQNSLSDRLKRPGLLVNAGLVAGNWQTDAQSGERFSVTNPATGETIAELPDMGTTEADAAITAAHSAQKDWAAATAKERARVLRSVADALVANQEDLAKILTAEMGKPLAEAKGEILYGASYLEWFAEEAKRVYGDIIPGHQDDTRVVVLKQPVGVVASITPWNFPNAMMARKMAPALAVGCGFVAKPSELTPLSALAVGVLAQEAGLPDGLFSILTTTKSAEIGQIFCSHPNVRKVSFTGSTRVGKLLMKQAADRVLRTSMELGGNAPFIVFDDADLDAAVAGAMICKYRNNGQTCVCANRIFVQDSVYDEFAQKLAEAAQALGVGDGFEATTNVGPLINEAALEKVKRHIADATSKGATILTGGAPHARGGTFFQPTVLTNVTGSMDLASEETFGPVAPLFRFNDVEEVIKQANATDYGLAAYFYANDLSRVWRVAEALEFGIVGVNTGIISSEMAPFGGVKESGQGREGSKYGIDDYLDIKYVCMGGV